MDLLHNSVPLELETAHSPEITVTDLPKALYEGKVLEVTQAHPKWLVGTQHKWDGNRMLYLTLTHPMWRPALSRTPENLAHRWGRVLGVTWKVVT